MTLIWKIRTQPAKSTTKRANPDFDSKTSNWLKKHFYGEWIWRKHLLFFLHKYPLFIISSLPIFITGDHLQSIHKLNHLPKVLSVIHSLSHPYIQIFLDLHNFSHFHYQFVQQHQLSWRQHII